MSSALQNRLVGTIIIVALAVIFLPDVLDGKKQTSQDVFITVPEQPEMLPVENAPDFPVEQIKQQTERKAEIVPDVATDDFDLEEQPAEALPEPPMEKDATVEQVPASETAAQADRKVPDEVPTPVNKPLADDRLLEEAGWVVQLGVFRHQKNVRELIAKLQKAGYRAFSRPVKTSSGELTKVFVGPDLQKDTLQNALPHLRELTKLQGRITPFTVK